MTDTPASFGASAPIGLADRLLVEANRRFESQVAHPTWSKLRDFGIAKLAPSFCRGIVLPENRCPLFDTMF
jgi:hypothetical protein